MKTILAKLTKEETEALIAAAEKGRLEDHPNIDREVRVFTPERDRQILSGVRALRRALKKPVPAVK